MNPTALRLLLVEDCEADALLLIHQLEQGGFAVQWERVETAAQMRAALEQRAWDLVIADYAVPGFEAPAALALLQQTGRDIPFLVVSGAIGEERAVAMMKAGAKDFLTKQNLARLVPAVTRELQEAQGRRHRKQLQAELQWREQWLNSFFSNATAGLCILDRDLRYVQINETLARINGRTVQEHLDRTIREVVPNLAPTLEGVLRQVLDKGQPALNLEISGETPDRPAELRHWIVSYFPLRGEIDRPIGVGAVVVEVTEHKRAEAALRESEEKLRQAQKMEAIGQLAGGVAHDFNNILAATLMHLGLLQQRPGLAEDIQGIVQELEGEATRAANLTRQLLLFSRRQQPRFDLLDLNEVVQNLLKMLRRLLGENIEIILQAVPTAVWVKADAGMLEQVVMNLCVNARDAMPQGGRLTLTTQVVDLETPAATAHPEARPGRFVCLEVTDSGCGMPEAVLQRLFEPFFTTKAAGKGTGLGLATVYGIVKQHEGWLTVSSAVGHGSSFRVYLPAASPESPAPATATAPEEIKGGSETILLVEDELSLRRSAALCLRKLGYGVLEAADAAQALQVWEQHRERIALLLTDQVMPGTMTGWGLGEYLRAQQPRLKVILSSGYSDQLGQFQATAGDSFAFLAKPYRAATLAQHVRRCLDGEPPRTKAEP
jgi:two-component system, cell cycle sensor histidine kinase and response regulator CckA